MGRRNSTYVNLKLDKIRTSQLSVQIMLIMKYLSILYNKIYKNKMESLLVFPTDEMFIVYTGHWTVTIISPQVTRVLPPAPELFQDWSSAVPRTRKTVLARMVPAATRRKRPVQRFSCPTRLAIMWVVCGTRAAVR